MITITKRFLTSLDRGDCCFLIPSTSVRFIVFNIKRQDSERVWVSMTAFSLVIWLVVVWHNSFRSQGCSDIFAPFHAIIAVLAIRIDSKDNVITRTFGFSFSVPTRVIIRLIFHLHYTRLRNISSDGCSLVGFGTFVPILTIPFWGILVVIVTQDSYLSFILIPVVFISNSPFISTSIGVMTAG